MDDQTHIYAENGIIENIQAYLLAIACIIYLVTGTLEKKSYKLIFLFCSLICYASTLRELEVEKFDIPHALIFIGHGIGLKITVGALAFAIFVCATLNFSYQKNEAVRFARSKSGQLLIAGAAFLLIGDFFEKNKEILHHVFFEEITELFGYTLILLSSIFANFFLSRLTTLSKWALTRSG
ncbi:MAG: hypothetical protein Q8K83_00095 [Methylotenera sp.]|nr:hypothetical protein [Methylotenera sp.]